MTTIRITTTILSIALVGVLLDFTTADVSNAYAAGSLESGEGDIAQQQQQCAPQQSNCEAYSEEQGEERSDIVQHQEEDEEEDSDEDNLNPGEK